MKLDRIFFGYMALVGAAAGAVLVAVPRTQEFAVKPYFWVLIAVAVFDVGTYLAGRNANLAMLPMGARLTGFVIGAVTMMAIAALSGTEVQYF